MGTAKSRPWYIISLLISVCTGCVHTNTANAVGGWGTNYTEILPDFNTGPVLPCNIEQIFTWKNRPYGRFGRILVQLVPQPPTALAVYVCTHTAQKPVAPPRLPLYLGRGSRGKVISVLWLGVPALSRSYLRSSCTWRTRVVPFALTFHLYAWSSIVSLVLTLQLLGTKVNSMASRVKGLVVCL